MVPAGPDAGGGSRGETAKAVGLKPLGMVVDRDRRHPRLSARAEGVMTPGLEAALVRWRIRSSMQRTTSAVHPVWWLAPTPRPVSPWKYSWNSTRSRQWGSSA